ncbi:MAG TPA: DUF5317 domain-containing protein [Actinomycetes bacterium]|nr:DUF5317 domain-containing protein [Actinomycetes bacterium]
MIIPLLGVLAVLSPVLVGGDLRRLGDLRFRGSWVVLIALVAQVVVLSVIPGENRTVLASVHLATYAAAGWFVAVNRRVPGILVIAVGAASNALAIALNGGQLPASRAALQRAGLHLDPHEFVNSGVLAHPHLAFLGDVFATPAWVPLANVFSIGDLLILCGVAWGSHRACGSRLVPAWSGRPTTEGAEVAEVAHAVPTPRAEQQPTASPTVVTHTVLPDASR